MRQSLQDRFLRGVFCFGFIPQYRECSGVDTPLVRLDQLVEVLLLAGLNTTD